MNPDSPTPPFRIVVIGGTGLIGTKVVNKLRALGHQVVAASPSTGVNTITGEGLKEAITGAQVVVDVANSPSFEEKAVLEFFETAGRNILAAEAIAGVKHHVALSVVGLERLPGNTYFRAKLAQEKLIRTAGIPYSILRATQFFEFTGAIAERSTQGQTVRVSPALFQPIAAEDVASAVADAALAAPVNGITEVAGPEKIGMAALVRRYLSATGDSREVVEDPAVGYFGQPIDGQSLTPGDKPRIGSIRFNDWLTQFTTSK
ncbi:SDR family oxidoreductase [Luteolibacter sp. Populi]|uniref:SDR family oxidoreductase n=1 Tax=Luteolibacter sp. Populi TaxID=3230487 RepID=UPI003465794A